MESAKIQHEAIFGRERVCCPQKRERGASYATRMTPEIDYAIDGEDTQWKFSFYRMARTRLTNSLTSRARSNS